MVLYQCYCGYKTNLKDNMRKHLRRQISCIPGEDMKLLNIDSLCIERTFVNLSHLTQEEKRERHKQQTINSNTKFLGVGKMSIEKFAKNILSHMKESSKRRNHSEVKFTIKNIINLLQMSEYIVPNTIVGDLIFPMMLTNGYHNTASFDRINNDLGYFEENIEIRPHFLNTFYKLTSQDIKHIVKIREEKQNEEELIDIAKHINKYDSLNFFYGLADSAKNNSTNGHINKIFDFKSIKDCGLFLIKKFIDQGGRCFYTNIPIYPKVCHKYKISPERIDPSKGYSKNNIILIVVGLNGRPYGQFLNKHITDEQRKKALEEGKFNQEYWDLCTKMTQEITRKCEEVRKYGNKILLENLSINLD